MLLLLLNLNISAVDCVWGEWEAWPDCPSGCPVGGGLQEKTRTRVKAVVASCNGTECVGHEFEKKHCSREEEVLEMHSELSERHETCQQNASIVAEELEQCLNRGTVPKSEMSQK